MVSGSSLLLFVRAFVGLVTACESARVVHIREVVITKERNSQLLSELALEVRLNDSGVTFEVSHSVLQVTVVVMFSAFQCR